MTNSESSAGYHVINPNDLAPTPDRPCDRRPISEAASLDNLAVNIYTVDPGQAIPLAYHVHEEQEEVFYVLSGTLTVQTPNGDYSVDTDEAFVAEPKNPHYAHVPEDADGTARVVAIGAPAVDDVSPYNSDE